MKRVFLVTGYPRSRTTWLSMFLTSGKTLCMHEPILMFDKRFVGLVGYVARLPYANVGISDSAIPAMLSLYALAWPDAPVLVVERPKEEALQSARRRFGFKDGRTEKAFDVVESGLQDLEAHFPTVKRIPFASLETVQGAQAAWGFCCPDQPFDEHRFTALNRVVCEPKY